MKILNAILLSAGLAFGSFTLAPSVASACDTCGCQAEKKVCEKCKKQGKTECDCHKSDGHSGEDSKKKAKEGKKKK